MGREIIMTEEGYAELEKRLSYLRVDKRTEIAKNIQLARDLGDISENAEYDAAKAEQGEIEGEIQSIEEQLSSAKVVKASDKDTSTVGIGCLIKILDIEENEKLEYYVVGTTEVKAANNRISNESPLGKALLGHKKGEKISVASPHGIIEYKILSIN